MLDFFSGLFSEDIAIDLGTANILVHVRGKGVMLDEPSLIALVQGSGGSKSVHAVGRAAKEMYGKTHAGITVIKPLKDGVIADFDAVAQLLQHCIFQVHRRNFLMKPRIVISAPNGVTEVERRAVREAARSAGAREVYLIEEPLAAALGADLPIHEAHGSMIVDIGSGTTEIAVIALYGVVLSRSLRLGGDKMDEAIISAIKRKYNLLIGEKTAEDLKIALGNCLQGGEVEKLLCSGNDLLAGVPRQQEVTSIDIAQALLPLVEKIGEGIRNTLEQTPPELSADILDRGIVLAGGGALLRGLDAYLSELTRVSVRRSSDPIKAVVHGAGKALEDDALLKKVAF